MRPERVELPTYGFVVRRSIQLSYGRRLGSVAQTFLASGCSTGSFENCFECIEVDGVEAVIVNGGTRIVTKKGNGLTRERMGKFHGEAPNETIFGMLPLTRRFAAPSPFGRGTREIRTEDQEQPLVEPQFRHL